jgi:hypothetical protein
MPTIANLPDNIEDINGGEICLDFFKELPDQTRGERLLG